ncbi:MAG: hypothetical protein WC263_04120 [Candidatus Micrarchaeia archaeon]|jgi:hypothetical protein
MALIMKDGKEVRVPGRKIQPSKQRRWVYVDSISLSEFRKMGGPMREGLLAVARYEIADGISDKKARDSLLVKSARGFEEYLAALLIAEKTRIYSPSLRGFEVLQWHSPDVIRALELISRRKLEVD